VTLHHKDSSIFSFVTSFYGPIVGNVTHIKWLDRTICPTFYVPYGCGEDYKNKIIQNQSSIDYPIVEFDREAMMSDSANIIKMGLTTNTEEWTDDEKATACETIGAMRAVPAFNDSPALVVINKDGATSRQRFSSTPSSYIVPISNSKGNIKTNTPEDPEDCANKGYVDDNFVPAVTLSAGQADKAYIVNANGQALMDIIPGEPKQWTIPQRTYNGRLVVGTPEEDDDATTKKYVDDLAYSIVTKNLWTPVHKKHTNIVDTDGRGWSCDAIGYYNTKTEKYKIEYTLISTQEITAYADKVAISVPLIGVNYTLGAKYRAATIAYSELPTIEDDPNMSNAKFEQSYFTLDGFTWDEQTDIGNECTPLPFRGSGGFEVKVLTWTEDPVASITFKTIIAKVTKYEK
jgi:hypothetical protein